MRVAIISDIHANVEALAAVLEAIDNERVDKTICLGDLVGYYANPNECVQFIRERNIQCIAGNHDRVAAGTKEPTKFVPAAKHAIYWTRKQLTEDNRQFLESLPITEVIDDRFLVVHASLTPEPNEDNYVNSKDKIRECFRRLIQFSPAVNVCFFGHTHHSVAYESRGGAISILEPSKVRLDRNAHYLVNPGSVGQPRDRDPRAAFLIFDLEEDVIEFHRVAYDVTSCWRKAAEAGLLYREGLFGRLENWLVTCKEVIGLRHVG